MIILLLLGCEEEVPSKTSFSLVEEEDDYVTPQPETPEPEPETPEEEPKTGNILKLITEVLLVKSCKSYVLNYTYVSGELDPNYPNSGEKMNVSER